MSAGRCTKASWVFGAGLLLAGLALGCATPPKPPELEALEALRASNDAKLAEEYMPDHVTAADTFMTRSRRHWEDNDMYEARRDALTGQIRLKTAIAVAQQRQAQSRIKKAAVNLVKAQDEYARLAKEQRALEEQVALMKKLREAQAAAEADRQKAAQALSAEQQKAEAEKEKLAAQLSLEQAKAAASSKLKAAELSLKTADTVNATTHANAQYLAAADMLVRAQKEFEAGNFKAVETSADLARVKAEESTALARPLYEKAAEAEAAKARNEALARDAASLPGITTRLERRGDLQRLILPLHDLHVKKEIAIAAGRDGVLNAVAELLKKYPTYPVQVVGYTDSRGKPDVLVAMSLARAQSVYSALITRGVEAGRMVVSGQGQTDPVADNKSAAGRARNNRVEVVILYH